MPFLLFYMLFDDCFSSAATAVDAFPLALSASKKNIFC
jgi:hypothetical protein